MSESGAPVAVVLGLGQNGLATVRALGRRGVRVVGVDANLEQPTARSRYCRAVRCPAFRAGGESLVQFLVDLGARLPERGVLFPSGDLNLLAVSEHRTTLAPFFHVALPAREIVRLILDKTAFYDFTARAGFPIPVTRRVHADNVEEVAASLTYPALLKPALRDTAWRLEHDVKLYEMRSAEELRRAYERLAPLGVDLLAQELIPGPDHELRFSLTYLDADGMPLAMFTGRKIRQYPPRFGTSSMAESLRDPDVAELSIALLRALAYRGYASVEFKRDPRDGALKIMEVTGRTWYPHGLATHCGVNLPYLAYCHQTGLPLPRVEPWADGVKWIDEDRDVRSALAERRAGRLGLVAWLRSYRGRRTYALSALDDPGPALALARRTTRAALRRLPLRGTR